MHDFMIKIYYDDVRTGKPFINVVNMPGYIYEPEARPDTINRIVRHIIEMEKRGYKFKEIAEMYDIKLKEI
ncbi:hypothetical protein [Leuconostoc gasicomitatum]|uniref:hypothetical protein n=1 Tax=Leuconostoc gasicomitatum TaxID=115778 RepID=UPI001CC69FD0|nr:hypothetical protein [Leuconostoc gasicomitatum]MBZ5968986.1 hypothetical protein [Leuconostoc gasicomitatum]